MNTDWNRTLKDILNKFSAQIGTIHWLNLQDEHLYLLAASEGIPQAVLEASKRIPLGKGIAGTAALTRKPVTICNLQNAPETAAQPLAKQTGARGSLCVPALLASNKVVGTLGIARQDEREFTQNEVSALVEIARSLASTLYLHEMDTDTSSSQSDELSA